MWRAVDLRGVQEGIDRGPESTRRPLAAGVRLLFSACVRLDALRNVVRHGIGPLPGSVAKAPSVFPAPPGPLASVTLRAGSDRSRDNASAVTRVVQSAQSPQDGGHRMS